jgi:hypothetical protein
MNVTLWISLKRLALIWDQNWAHPLWLDIIDRGTGGMTICFLKAHSQIRGSQIIPIKIFRLTMAKSQRESRHKIYILTSKRVEEVLMMRIKEPLWPTVTTITKIKMSTSQINNSKKSEVDIFDKVIQSKTTQNRCQKIMVENQSRKVQNKLSIRGQLRREIYLQMNWW